ncbi:DUF1634 domain-containing protein [Melioribacter sp. OK-6-Me]|uniref:DUF1634 domain-containing protein n=1 Tax=unclassified Melioribacter TaxID=2627329 RepID=UPI003ED98FCB
MNLKKYISGVLSIGIYTTVFFYLCGIIIVVIKGDAKDFFSVANIVSLKDFFTRFFALDPAPFFYLGTLVLILTPIMRVLFSCYYFYKIKDTKFFFITIAVVLILVLSVSIGLFFSLNLG